MLKVPEKYRWGRHPIMPSSEADGCNGAFMIPHYKIADYLFLCIVSDGENYGWQHVSVTVMRKGKNADRCPTWAEMCWIKDQFWDKEDCVMQLHPPESEYVSTHNFCLHLWKPLNQEIPQPPSLMVGRKDLKHENLKDASVSELQSIMRGAKTEYDEQNRK